MSLFDALPSLDSISEEDLSQLLEAVSEQSRKYSGGGSYHGTYQTFMSKINRYGVNFNLMNAEVAGLTFITRPKLNLTSGNIKQHPVLATMDTSYAQSLTFAIRCLLDTKFAGKSPGLRDTDLLRKARMEILKQADASAFLNNDVPFIIPLTNGMESITGWSDFVLDTETTEGDIFSGDQIFAKGSDMLNRATDLSLTFRDIPGGVLRSLLYYWVFWIALAAKGVVNAYPEDIAARRLPYTCSIYRFILDTSKRTIVMWSKATGCFPRAFPIGNMFNVNEYESHLSSSTRFTVPFAVNHIEYANPQILMDFNMIMSTFAGRNYQNRSDYVITTNLPENNFVGIPYIDIYNGTNELQFLATADELDNPADRKFEEIIARYKTKAE
jgi:hypothetical protein